MEDLQVDFRDTLVSLGELWLAASRAGIDPSPYFQEVAAISSPETTNVDTSMREVLANFELSAYFIEAVRPNLDRWPET
jgi:hypothetical protein